MSVNVEEIICFVSMLDLLPNRMYPYNKDWLIITETKCIIEEIEKMKFTLDNL